MVKKILTGIVAISIVVASLIYFKVLWTLAPYYELETQVAIKVPIMDMESYKDIWDTHRRPYVYSLNSKSSQGQVIIFGIDHTKDPSHPHLDSLRFYWEGFQPDVVLVEGRVGNLFRWIQDPILELGEGGLVTDLANTKGIHVYSWEPERTDQIDHLTKKYTVQEVAMFYTFRPYFSNMRYGAYENPESMLQEYLTTRTDYPKLQGVFTSWEELDRKWQRDFPGIDWRNYGSGHGYPEGYLNDIWNDTNILRDEHMIKSIAELVSHGRKVFVTMGVSHAPRIEMTLRDLIK